jgi:prepilin-type processing-associated H-X9-DG protein
MELGFHPGLSFGVSALIIHHFVSSAPSRIPERILRESASILRERGDTCEAAGFHHGGGNFLFLDGHSHKIDGNAERYLKKRTDGKWFELYCAYDME